MFKQIANIPCNNILFKKNKIDRMAEHHESMVRLYQAAKEKKVTGQSAVARALNVSPQVVKNWESRGISEKGARLAQAVFGCDSSWLLDSQTVKYSTESLLTPETNVVREIGPQSITDPWILDAIGILSRLTVSQREGAVATLRVYVAQLGPPRDGQALQMAGQKKGGAGI